MPKSLMIGLNQDEPNGAALSTLLTFVINTVSRTKIIRGPDTVFITFATMLQMVATTVDDHLYGRFSYDIFPPHYRHWLLSITAQNLP